MQLSDRIRVLVQLGQHLTKGDEYLDALIHRTAHNNPWFTKENYQLSIQHIIEHYLKEDHLSNWIAAYDFSTTNLQKKVGLIVQEAIPLSSFRDVMAIFLSGHHAQIKLDQNDFYVLPYLIQILNDYLPETKSYFSLVQQLKQFDAVVTSEYLENVALFEQYFKKVPNLIRKPNFTIAILDGTEAKDELDKLSDDILLYFGLGNQSVSKIYVPKSYDFEPLLEVIHEKYKQVVLHSKYKNNFDYNYSLQILNKMNFQANGCIMLLEDPQLVSRIATLHYEYYTDLDTLKNELQEQFSSIKNIVSLHAFDEKCIPFGTSQFPKLEDKAVLEFLNAL